MELSRVLPILIQFGIGALLGGVGLWAGIKSGYVDLREPDGRRTIFILVAGYIAFLVAYCLFTFYLPFVPEPPTP